MAELFEEDADFINVVGLWWDNRQDIYEAHDYGLRVIFKDSTLKVVKLKTKKLSDGAAVVHAKMNLTGQTAVEGQEGGTRRTVFSFIVRKEGDDWTCASAQNTDIVLGAETYIRTEDGGLKSVDYRKK